MNEPGPQDPIMVTLGTSVFAAPWLLPATFGDPMAGDTMAWAFVLTGLATGAIAVAGIVLPGHWQALVEFVLGIWLMVLPWIVEPFVEPAAATWAAIVVGAFIVVLSGVFAFSECGHRPRQE
ncbi:SPW repeat protein [Rhizobium sp. R693]|uniref:SPW repeat domain-containing protein n=1 Tax=Rhizobium sp. R693 TaxID=1764276 RepID=UPI000B534F9D|nr:SPW repeat protein [Rhizobium sp. R693]